jgi:medium-chain acyl-[acyl-carrier-protein] hydrolase
MTWKENFKVHTFDADFNNRIKLSSIFNFMQDAASNNANQLKFGFNDLSEKGQTWVLSRALIKIFDSVSFNDDIVVETWPKGVDRLFALRDFNLYNVAGKLIGIATTAWLLIDIKTLRPTRLNDFNHKIPPVTVKPAIDMVPDKITPCPGKEIAGEFTAGYSDIDLNRHVNNVKYIEYILDSFSEDFYANKKISSLQINFLSELKLGEKISVFKCAYDENKYYLEGVNQKEVKIFQSLVDWD